jgi:ribosomal-protein-alanine N-acetyltransferase
MRIRRAQEQDLAAFSQFSQSESLGTGWGPNAFRDSLKNDQDRLWVAMEAGDLKGFLVSRVIAGEAELLNVVVGSDSRRNGIGRELMRVWLEQMQEESVERLFLEVRVSNLPAINLYQSLGFKQVGTRVGYYQPDLEDALVMARGL